MRRKACEKLIFALTFVLAIQIFSFAKQNPFECEVDEPIAEEKNNVSNGIIYSKNPYKEYNPLNPVKPGIDVEEYDLVDNYIIDLKTLDFRIKYFSPTYNNVKANAESMSWMAYYVRGGNDTLFYNYKSYTDDMHDLARAYKKTLDDAIAKRKKYSEGDIEYDELTDIIKSYTDYYSDAFREYNVDSKTISITRSRLGLSSALYNIGNLDNNYQVAFARRAVTKTITSVVLTYLQLKDYCDILDKQTKLYHDIYDLKQNNLKLGLATSVEVSEALNTYEITKNNYKKTKTTLSNVKEQIAINLGYKLSDIDKLQFNEPFLDMEYVNSIDLENDKSRAVTSNSYYTSISLNNKDRKLPGSTGEETLNNRLNYAKEKIINELESIHSNLMAKLYTYEGSLYLYELCEITDEANKRKLENKLVNELEYKGLEIQNLASKLQVKSAKYDLINAINDYYYATLGHINIT